ncbi:2OG-Fe(II) oxygenase [Pseudoalteromonas sp. MMG012]|uniref:2OG-Fe(II) oxygenase n=1 Tax=Pseudoalteromonas sp. MMG012 TaxID=2822686 RepID=UPI001B3A5E6F|nr:2OG-Fe(II) oxygenase [Pseudoalteromonas sp. MMG012]MBQ4851218.1 2OG-Fe(II) oxygenase [Pseudoalteromonas sp. MMG012]
MANTCRVSLLVPGLFASDECENIIELMEKRTLHKATVWDGLQYSVDETKRRNGNTQIGKNKESQWIYDRMDLLFFKAADHWGFEVEGTKEPLKYLKYDQGDHFSQWHADIGTKLASERKLSMSVQLNNACEFTGGVLEIGYPRGIEGEPLVNNLEAGDAIIFPSFIHHRVTPILTGTRHSLVNWISGPPFR